MKLPDLIAYESCIMTSHIDLTKSHASMWDEQEREFTNDPVTYACGHCYHQISEGSDLHNRINNTISAKDYA